MMWILSFLLTAASLFGEQPNYYNLSEADFFALESLHQPIDPNKVDTELIEAAVFFTTNQYRKSKRKDPLTFHETLLKSARLHSKSMMDLQFFNHINKKERKLRTPFDRVKFVGGDAFTAVGENLIEAGLHQLGKNGSYHIQNGKLVDKKGTPLPFYTYAALAQEVVQRWAASKGHRENLLESYQFLGCGLSAVRTEKDGLKIVYITQNFASKN
jgi:uncharacterized protein YkwD